MFDPNGRIEDRDDQFKLSLYGFAYYKMGFHTFSQQNLARADILLNMAEVFRFLQAEGRDDEWHVLARDFENMAEDEIQGN